MKDVSFVQGWVRERAGPRVVEYVEVQPHRTASWRLPRDVELRVVEESIWLTRHLDSYDYWLKPGDVVRLSRGERVWISSDSARAVEVSLTSYRRESRGAISQWLERLWPRVTATRT
ncbi:Serine-pyruvate aminotransferase/archaeal aspartate aminotransferase [Candidatus Burkholderia verschuerenii]|uniref:Serine-pyruvate aminotransferase/archaeal aspartate aminotransferase n=1 Tax=Candidatus Burkholderia verschuerenii TaxID=242163 RepID=A0A0L0MA54_9BURK|nr:DUF2917 domain-containing protein [Candidatus Burkholderia verschuerenii]KND59263.1 Serine-pyruvate aminotransferase/archaeal aspartate aminotransferase [Candidatus Burkholderia verschuerenii]